MYETHRDFYLPVDALVEQWPEYVDTRQYTCELRT